MDTKRIICICIVLIVLSLFLLACGAESNDESSDDLIQANSGEDEDSSENQSVGDSSAGASSTDDSSPDDNSSDNNSSDEDSSDDSSQETTSNNDTTTGTSTAESNESSDDSTSAQTSTPNTSSNTSSNNTSSDTSSNTTSSQTNSSDTTSQPKPPVVKTAVPKIYGCTNIENGYYVILGTCEIGATITAKCNTQTVTSKSDMGYFSIRLKKDSPTMTVKLTAITGSKAKSDELSYSAAPKAVSVNQWPLIAGDDYQFHLRSTLDDYLRNNKFDSTRLTNLENTVKNRLTDLKSISPGLEIIYMIVPSPMTIYPEGVPSIYKPTSNDSRLEQVTQTLTDAGATVLRLTDSFTEHKNDELKLFWKTDSHWTDYGGFIAYTELFNHISKKFPAAAPRAYNEFNWKQAFYFGGDISHYLEYFDVNAINQSARTYPFSTLMKEYNAFREPKFSLPPEVSPSIMRYRMDQALIYSESITAPLVINTNRKNLPTAIVYRDSFGTQVHDIIAERFNLTYYKPMWDFTVYKSDIQSYKPDYLIYVLTEHNIENFVK